MTIEIPDNVILNAAVQHVAKEPDFADKVAAQTAKLKASHLWIYTLADVARELRKSRSTVRRWREEGLIEFRNGKTTLSEILSVSERAENIEPKEIRRNAKPIEQPKRRSKI